jgi:hypothetical protein
MALNAKSRPDRRMSALPPSGLEQGQAEIRQLLPLARSKIASGQSSGPGSTNQGSLDRWVLSSVPHAPNPGCCNGAAVQRLSALAAFAKLPTLHHFTITAQQHRAKATCGEFKNCRRTKFRTPDCAKLLQMNLRRRIVKQSRNDLYRGHDGRRRRKLQNHLR